MLVDRHHRIVDYLRLSVTDKCNLRCDYCMPENMKFVSKKSLLSYEEMMRICSLLVAEGVQKIRLTGGEPFLRKDIMLFIRELTSLEELNKLAITTNGVGTIKYLDELISMGINSFNLSLDTLDKDRFLEITKRDSFDVVMECLHQMLKNKLDLRVNCVVMDGKNTEDIIPMVEFAMEHDVSIRFIEEMPFNGNGKNYQKLEWDHRKILSHISEKYPDIKKLQDPKNSTSLNYKIDGFKGSFGIIPAYTRSFCGTCNRIRITPEGTFKTCLYDQGIFNLRDLMRAGATDVQIMVAIKDAIGNKSKDGFDAEQNRSEKIFESMSSIGG